MSSCLASVKRIFLVPGIQDNPAVCIKQCQWHAKAGMGVGEEVTEAKHVMGNNPVAAKFMNFKLRSVTTCSVCSYILNFFNANY